VHDTLMKHALRLALVTFELLIMNIAHVNLFFLLQIYSTPSVSSYKLF
jgi:hypothetical protein